VLLGSALALFLLGLTEGPTWGWGNWSGATIGGVTLGSPEFFVASAIVLVGFILWERRSALPIVDFRKLAERNILLSNLVGLFAGVAMFLLFVGIVARAEATPPVGLGKTPLDFGFYSLPTTLVNMACAPFVGKWVGRAGPKPAMMFGSLLIIGGGFLLTGWNDQVVYIILFTIPVMTGIIAIFIAMINLVVVSSKPQETGVQTGMNLTFRNLGTSIGPIAGSVILASVLSTYTKVVSFPGGTLSVSYQAPGNPAFELIFGLIGGLGIVCLLLSLPIRNFRIRSDGTRVAAGGQETPTPALAPTPPGTPVRASQGVRDL
jgi:MFS family permease